MMIETQSHLGMTCTEVMQLTSALAQPALARSARGTDRPVKSHNGIACRETAARRPKYESWLA